MWICWMWPTICKFIGQKETFKCSYHRQTIRLQGKLRPFLPFFLKNAVFSKNYIFLNVYLKSLLRLKDAEKLILIQAPSESIWKLMKLPAISKKKPIQLVPVSSIFISYDSDSDSHEPFFHGTLPVLLSDILSDSDRFLFDIF